MAGVRGALWAGVLIASVVGAQALAQTIPADVEQALAQDNWEAAARATKRWMERVWCDAPGEILKAAKAGRWEEVDRLLKAVERAPGEWWAAMLTNWVCGLHQRAGRDRLLMPFLLLAGAPEDEEDSKLAQKFRPWAEVYRRLAEAHPDSAACQFCCASVYDFGDESDEARRYYDRAVNLAPNDGWVRLLGALADEEPDQQELERLGGLLAGDPLACFLLAVAWDEAGDKKRALSWIRRGYRAAWGQWLIWTMLRMAESDWCESDEEIGAIILRVVSTLKRYDAGWAWDLPRRVVGASDMPSFREVVRELELE